MKKRVVGFAALAVALVLILSALLSEYGFSYRYDTAFADAYRAKYRSGSDGWEEIGGAEIVLTAGRYTLTMDPETTYFTLRDDAGRMFGSYPRDEGLTPVTVEDTVRLRSNVSLRYYTTEKETKYMSSGLDGSFRILRKGSSLRIVYAMGYDAESAFLPMVFRPEIFENALQERLSAAQIRRLTRFYTLFSPEYPDESGYAAALEAYPALAKEPLYVYQGDLDAVAVADVTAVIGAAGYTQEAYERDTQGLGLAEGGASASGFSVPLQLELTENGLTASILMDQVKTVNSTDILEELYLLEFFGAQEQQTGYFVLPDGSGAFMRLDSTSGEDFSKAFYAPNPTIPEERRQQLTQIAHLPFYGYSGGGSGYLAVVESGASAARLTARVRNNTNVVSNLFSAFRVRDAEESSIGEDRGLPVINLFAASPLIENPAVTYTLLSDTFDENEMTRRYSARLAGGAEETENAPVYLDFICGATLSKTFLGVPYTSFAALSTFSGIENAVRSLHEAGIDHLRVRLKGLIAGGIRSGAVGGLAWNGKVGSREEFESLKKLLQSRGGALYIDIPVGVVWKNRAFDAYPMNTYPARRLNETQAAVKQYDLATLLYNGESASLASPGTYNLTVRKIAEAYKKDSIFEGVGLSWSDVSGYLPADYSRKNEYQRGMAAAAVGDALAAMKQSAGLVMTDRASDYMLGAAADLVNVPLYSSGYLSESGDLQLYAAALKGKRRFAGHALNLSSSFGRDLALSAAVGAGQYYLLITEDEKLLRKAGLAAEYYSLSASSALPLLTAHYAGYNAAYAAGAGSAIRKISRDGNLLSVEYENGRTVTANTGGAAAGNLEAYGFRAG